MELKVMSFDGKSAGSVSLSDAIFGLEPRPDILQRCHLAVGQAPRRTHKVKNRARSRTGKRCIAKRDRFGTPRFGAVNLFQRRRPFVRPGGAQP
jgi:large subunit ribosomal protein L4